MLSNCHCASNFSASQHCLQSHLQLLPQFRGAASFQDDLQAPWLSRDRSGHGGAVEDRQEPGNCDPNPGDGETPMPWEGWVGQSAWALGPGSGCSNLFVVFPLSWSAAQIWAYWCVHFALLKATKRWSRGCGARPHCPSAPLVLQPGRPPRHMLVLSSGTKTSVSLLFDTSGDLWGGREQDTKLMKKALRKFLL